MGGSGHGACKRLEGVPFCEEGTLSQPPSAISRARKASNPGENGSETCKKSRSGGRKGAGRGRGAEIRRGCRLQLRNASNSAPSCG